MNAELLLAHFNRISDAPDAVPRLRRFVLDLAVRGRLVEQDPNDEPVTELLKRIDAEKRRLTKAAGLKHPILPPVAPSEAPFNLPSSWTWIRVGWGFQYDAGAKREPNSLLPDRWLLELEDIERNTSVVQSRLRVKDRDSRSTKSEFVTGDILYGKLRPYLNKVVVADEVGYSTTEIVAIRPFVPMCSSYCCLAFRRPDFVEYVSQAGRGTKMPRLRTEDALVALFPVPPIAEQHRIVTKVDQLTALCDQLEAAQRERERHRDLLAAAAHHHLNNGVDTEALRSHAQFFIGHIPRLTARPDQIRQLRRTILDLAVRGKLVPQDPNRQTSHELLKQIEARRSQSIAAKTLKVPSGINNSISRCIALAIPTNWTWAKCGNILFVTKLAGFEYTKYFSLQSVGEVPAIRAQNVKPWCIEKRNLLYIDRKTSQLLDRSALTKPCILMTFIGAGIGDVALFSEQTRWHLAPNVAKIETFAGCEDLLDLRYLTLFLNSGFGRAEIFKHLKSTAQPSISMGTIRDIDIALPPINEQKQIVAKIDELMTLCDQLEARLTTAQTEAGRLLESVLHNALLTSDEEASASPSHDLEGTLPAKPGTC
jgi:type I restriction enzyme, S subunit